MNISILPTLSTRRVVSLAMVAGTIVGLGACGGDPGSMPSDASGTTTSGAAMTSTTSTSMPVNHVHGAVAGQAPGQILLGTHYGLRVSDDNGATWHTVPGMTSDMVAAIVKVPAGYVAAFQPMASSTGGAMPNAGMAGSAGSMSMGTPYVMHSKDGVQWTRSSGLPAGASISNLVAPDVTTVWATVTRHGIFRSADGGVTWELVLPTAALIVAIDQIGSKLVFATPDGVDVTSVSQPAMPAHPALSQPVNDIGPWAQCPTCLVATLASGAVATSRDGGITWSTVDTGRAFDNVVTFPSTGTDMIGMVSSPDDPHKGVWRSTDGGHTWSMVLDQGHVDYLFPTSGANTLLGFQWGITVWRSADAGATWTRLSTV